MTNRQQKHYMIFMFSDNVLISAAISDVEGNAIMLFLPPGILIKNR